MKDHCLRALILCLLALCLHLAAPASGNPLPREVTIAIINDVPSTRLGVALMEQAYARLGIDMQVQSMPSRRALHLANRGDLDGDLFRIAAAAREYPDLIRVDYPLLEGKLYAVVRDPSITSLPDPKDASLKVAVRRGVLIAEHTAKQLGMHSVRTESYEQIRNLLEHDRVDIGLISVIEDLSPLTGSEWEQLHILPEPVTHFTLYHYLHRGHAPLAAALVEVLSQMEQEGVKNELLQQILTNQ